MGLLGLFTLPEAQGVIGKELTKVPFCCTLLETSVPANPCNVAVSK